MPMPSVQLKSEHARQGDEIDVLRHAARDGAALDYARTNENRQARLAKEGWASAEVYQQTTSTLHQSEGVVALDKAAIAKAQLDLSRTVIRSPANGYVTNLLAQFGDYSAAGQKF